MVSRYHVFIFFLFPIKYGYALGKDIQFLVQPSDAKYFHSVYLLNVEL